MNNRRRSRAHSVCNVTSETIDCAGAREVKHAAVGERGDGRESFYRFQRVKTRAKGRDGIVVGAVARARRR